MQFITAHYYNIIAFMGILGLIVFISLYFIDAGYGKFRTNHWGYSIPNKLGWFLMEFPALCPILYVCITEEFSVTASFLISLYAIHYIYRSLVFPFLLNGKSQMPLLIVLMGALFNTTNSSLITHSLVTNHYDNLTQYMSSPWVLIGLALFVVGACTHLHADYIIRHLRKPGDTKHYLPQGGLFQWVTSANYLGELVEWIGYALLINNPAGWMFVWWTAANLVPRAHAIHSKYKKEFGILNVGKRKRILPFVY